MNNLLMIRQSRIQLMLVLALAFAYAMILASLPVNAFVDRANYIGHAQYSSVVLGSYLSRGLGVLLVNEPIWLILNIFLLNFFEPENLVRVLIFVSAFIAAFSMLRSARSLVVLIPLAAFLLLPQVAKNHIIHLRQGVAVAVFLLGWFESRKSVRWLLFLAASFIHSSFFFVISLYILSEATRLRNLSAKARLLLYVSACLAISIISLPVAELLGARQVAEIEMVASGTASGLGFIFWLCIAAIFFLQGRDFVLKNDFSLLIVVFYLSNYFLLHFSARIFEDGILVVLLACLGLTNYRKWAFYLLFAFYFLLQWYLRWNLPGLGWGIENYQ
jgi:hypothetical protein